MHFIISVPNDLISLTIYGIAWCVIGLIIYRYYVKQAEQPRLWKVLVVIWIAMFTFDVNISYAYPEQLNIPILPLGVWLLYGVLKRKSSRWAKYRGFAWISFGGNFIILISALLIAPVYQAVYPQDEVSTFIRENSQAQLIQIHPAGNAHAALKSDWTEEISDMNPGNIDWNWYIESRVDSNTGLSDEQFPYILIGTQPAWGSGLPSMIYLEKDGKGLLIDTLQEQVYFRSETSLLKEVQDGY